MSCSAEQEQNLKSKQRNGEAGDEQEDSGVTTEQLRSGQQEERKRTM
jgi:hypothetical protein